MKRKILLIIIFLILVSLVALYLIFKDQVVPVARVGAERIYPTSIKYEKINGQPNLTDEQILEKIANDSAILQGGQAMGYVQLDSAIYDAPIINQQLRRQKIALVKQQVANAGDYITGSIITLWFDNTEPSVLGYEKAKIVAKETAESLREKVAAGELTMLQAKKELDSDPVIRDLDPSAWQYNTYMEFDKVSEEKLITFDENFNKILRNSPINSTTEVFPLVGTARPGDNEKREIVYAFGQISERKSSENSKSLRQWEQEQLAKYKLVK